jgi:spore coat protein U-like protein
MKKHLVAPLTAGILLALAGAAQAATKTATFNVSATVVDNCTISAGALNLGTFDGTNNLTANSTSTVRCSNGTDYTVDLSAGSSGSFANRTLTNGSNSLVYNLYTAGDYQTVWGNGQNGTGRASDIGEGMGNPITHTVHGRLLASQNQGAIDAGDYSDTITATITY